MCFTFRNSYIVICLEGSKLRVIIGGKGTTDWRPIILFSLNFMSNFLCREWGTFVKFHSYWVRDTTSWIQVCV